MCTVYGYCLSNCWLLSIARLEASRQYLFVQLQLKGVLPKMSVSQLTGLHDGMLEILLLYKCLRHTRLHKESRAKQQKTRCHPSRWQLMLAHAQWTISDILDTVWVHGPNSESLTRALTGTFGRLDQHVKQCRRPVKWHMTPDTRHMTIYTVWYLLGHYMIYILPYTLYPIHHTAHSMSILVRDAYINWVNDWE